MVTLNNSAWYQPGFNTVPAPKAARRIQANPDGSFTMEFNTDAAPEACNASVLNLEREPLAIYTAGEHITASEEAGVVKFTMPSGILEPGQNARVRLAASDGISEKVVGIPR